MCLCSLPVCSPVFSLIISSFFIQCQANLAQRRALTDNEIPTSFIKIMCSCAEKENQKLIPEKTPSWRQCCSMSPYTQKQQRVSRKMGRGHKKPQKTQPQESFSGYCTLPQNAITGIQALVPALTKLGAVPLTAAHLWKFLLPNLTTTHWSTFFFFFLLERGDRTRGREKVYCISELD